MKTKLKTKAVTEAPSPRPSPQGEGDKHSGDARSVRLEAILLSGTNPRKKFVLDDLLSSIPIHGIVQRLLVRPLPLLSPSLSSIPNGGEGVRRTGEEAAAGNESRNEVQFELVCGERRYRAARELGLTEVPVEVRAMSDRDVREIQLLENLDREDLLPLEEAAGYAQLIADKVFGETIAENVNGLCAKLGRQRSHIYNQLALLKLSDPAQEAIAKGDLPVSIGYRLGKVPGEKLQAKALKKILKGGAYQQCMTARDAEAFLAREFQLDLKAAPFDIEDKTLDPQAGPCGECPYRSGNAPEEFPDIKSPHVCTHPDCYRHKADASRERQLQEYRDLGWTVLTAAESKPLFSREYWQGDRSEYVPAQYTHHTDPKRRTTAQLVKLCKENPPRALACVDGIGKVVELYRAAEVAAALVANGVIKARKGEKEPGGEGALIRQTLTPEQEAKQKFAREVDALTAERVALALIAAVEGDTKKAAEANLLRWFIRYLVDSSADYDWERIEERRGGDIFAKLAKLEAPQLRSLLLEMHLQDNGGFGDLGWDGNALEAAEAVWPVDRKAILKAAAKELKAANPDSTVAAATDTAPVSPKKKSPAKARKVAKKKKK